MCVAADLRFIQCLYFGESAGDVNFDSVVNACMGILQVTTFDTWSPAMYNLMAAFSPYVFIYFLLVALLGGQQQHLLPPSHPSSLLAHFCPVRPLAGFFVVNLFLAVVFDEFMRSKEINQQEDAIEEAKAAVEAAQAQEAEKEG